MAFFCLFCFVFLITLLHCASPVVHMQCPIWIEKACLIEYGKLYCARMFANGCIDVHMLNPVLRFGDHVSGDFLNLGKWIGGAQRHFCKLRGVLLMREDYCSVVMAWMLKLLDAVPSSVAAFWCSDAWVSWCLRASAVGVIEFLEVPWQHCGSADRWLRYDWHYELTAVMASLSGLLY